MMRRIRPDQKIEERRKIQSEMQSRPRGIKISSLIESQNIKTGMGRVEDSKPILNFKSV
jgi:hypothetical protein